MVTFGSHVGNHQFQPCLSGVYAGVILYNVCTQLSEMLQDVCVFFGVVFCCIVVFCHPGSSEQAAMAGWEGAR